MIGMRRREFMMLLAAQRRRGRWRRAQQPAMPVIGGSLNSSWPRKISTMLCIKNRWLVGLCLGFGLWAPSAGLAQQPIRIGATTALTGEASIQAFVKVTFFAKSMRMRKAECSGVGLSS